MRVAQLCADRGIAPGSTKGAAQHLRGIAAGLSKLGHPTTTYAARGPESHFPVDVHPIEDFDRATASSFEVVYERYSLGHRRGLDVAREAARPFVLEVNAPLVDEARAHRPGTITPDVADTEAHLLAEADLVITVSAALAEWAGSRRSGPTITLTNGFEPEWFRKPNRADPAFDLVFIGHPKPWHGADRLPKLLHDLAQRGVRATLLVIGGGPGAVDLVATATELGVDTQITVTGPLEPRAATGLLADAKIGIAPYRIAENFYFCPLKIVDYLAAGLPIVSTDQGDIPALVGRAGIIVPADSDSALTDAVERLLKDAELRLRLGENGRRQAFDAHTWDHVAARTQHALAQVGGISVPDLVVR